MLMSQVSTWFEQKFEFPFPPPMGDSFHTQKRFGLRRLVSEKNQ
jgi:hypothetical protein